MTGFIVRRLRAEIPTEIFSRAVNAFSRKQSDYKQLAMSLIDDP